MLVVRRGESASPALGLVLPLTLASGSASPVGSAGLWQLLWFFAKAGAVVFGSGLAIVPFLYGGVVGQFGWLDERQFLDAVAVSMITPGPVVITVAFIGYLVAGLPGALVAALGVFFPVYLSVVAGAPFFNRLARQGRAAAFVAGVTAAATGALAGAAVVLGRRAIPDGPTLAVALGTLVLLLRAPRVPELALMAAAGCLGVALAGS
jgi:chromate transporter